MQSLKRSQEILDKSTLFYLIATNTDGNFTYVNEKYAQAFSHINNHLTGQSLHTLIHPNDKKKCSNIHTKCIDNPGQAFSVIIRKRDKDTDYLYTQWECKAMFDDEKSPTGIYCIGYNISKYVAKQVQLKQAQEENERKRAVIDEIVFQQSHLIRAPLTNLMGLTTLFLDEQLLNVDSSSTCKMILDSTKQLDDIIRGVVKVSRN
jgi:PAS domain S-box-containing protein